LLTGLGGCWLDAGSLETSRDEFAPDSVSEDEDDEDDNEDCLTGLVGAEK